MQYDLFGTPTPTTEEARLGRWDARSGMPLRNGYSQQLSPERFAAYEAAYRQALSEKA